MTEAEVAQLIGAMDASVQGRNQSRLQVRTEGKLPDRTLDTPASYSATETVLTKPGGKQDKARVRNVAPKEERTFQGYLFDSKVEMERYQYLLALYQSGHIKALTYQKKFTFLVQEKPIFTLTVDFAYVAPAGLQYEDVKGQASSAVFRLKKRLIEAAYGIKIVEVRKNYKTGEWVKK